MLGILSVCSQVHFFNYWAVSPGQSADGLRRLRFGLRAHHGLSELVNAFGCALSNRLKTLAEKKVRTNKLGKRRHKDRCSALYSLSATGKCGSQLSKATLLSYDRTHKSECTEYCILIRKDKVRIFSMLGFEPKTLRWKDWIKSPKQQQLL